MSYDFRCKWTAAIWLEYKDLSCSAWCNGKFGTGGTLKSPLPSPLSPTLPSPLHTPACHAALFAHCLHAYLLTEYRLVTIHELWSKSEQVAYKSNTAPIFFITSANSEVVAQAMRTVLSISSMISLSLDRCHSCSFIARFWRATLWRHKVAVCNCACRTLQLCRIKAKIDQSAFTAFSRRSCTEYSTALFGKGVARLFKSCATRRWRITLAIFSHDKVARQRCATKLQVWHRSKDSF